MAAMDKTKEPQANDSAELKNEIMHVKPEDANVSLENAVTALKEAQGLLEAYHDADTTWQDPVELLNKTAAALDEAALATRQDGKESNAQSDKAIVSIGELSQEVIKERQAILDATQKVVAGTRPAELWNPNILIVYASHTMTSREYAHEFQSRLDSNADVMNIKDVSLLDLQERRRVYFICSTFGLGRPPRDAEVVYTTLQLLSTVDPEDGELDDMLVAAPEKEALLGLEVAVVALGNSKFEAFCKFGRELSARLTALGAQEFLPLTILDANSGKEEQTKQFREWERGALEFEGVSVPKEEAIIPCSDVQKGTSAESKCCVIL